jgi:eukaryotic-like serine/threonine-protein kinase
MSSEDVVAATVGPDTDHTVPLDPARAHGPVAGFTAGGQIGRYLVTGTVGQGGMGVVLSGHDPRLDRPVALKVLRPDLWGGAGAAGQDRLAREAQAMARLSHPNVVTVYEVGQLDDAPYLAMELIEGETLRRWQRAETRTWRAIVGIYVAAGRGLVAAHDAGLVHRDFKPDNVLVGRDDRPRVTDFGLVSDGVEVGTVDAADAPAQVGLSVRGGAIGTPAYMAPEQWTGDRVDARADQFAFCVALWEAVYRERPFPGARGAQIRERVLAGAPPTPPSDAAVPGWLRDALTRGLARDPAARWPTLSALLDELTRRSARRRVPAAVVGSAAAIAAGVATFVVAPGTTRGESCPDPDPRIAGIWDPRARDLVRARIDGADPGKGPARLGRIDRAVDGYVGQWRAAHVAACRATRVDGRQSDTLLDQRMTCLDARLAELAGTIDLLHGAPDGRALDKTILALDQLSPIASCADPTVVATFVPPATPVARATADELDAEARAIELARRAGRLDGLAERGAALVDRARDLGHARTLGVALAVAARVHGDRSDPARAVPLLYELIEVAAGSGDDHAAVFAWTHLVRVTSFDLGRPDEALAMVLPARSAVIRAGDPLDAQADLVTRESEVLIRLGRIPEARERLTAMRDRLVEAGADDPASPLRGVLGDLWLRVAAADVAAEDPRAAIAAYRAAIAAFDDVHGPDHPEAASALINLSEAYKQLGRVDEALDAVAHAARIRDDRVGDSPALAWALFAYASALREVGRLAEAAPIAERAIRVADATMDAGDLGRLAMLNETGLIYEALERLDDARAMYAAAIELGERSGAQNINLPIAQFNRGDAAMRLGRCAEAIPDFERSRDLFVAYAGHATASLLYPLRGLGQCQHATGEHAAAVATLERAIAIDAPGIGRDQQLLARLLLGRSLVASGQDPTRGRALITEARRAAAAAESAADLAALDAWLARHARR